MYTILVTGVSGSGKSTVCHKVGAGLGILNWDYADLMLRVAPDVRSKDELATLDWTRRNAIYRQVELLLEDLFGSTNTDASVVLFENHLSVLQDGTQKCFPIEDYQRYGALGLIVVEADPDAVVQRRRLDLKRERSIGTPHEVGGQQAINRREADAVTAFLSIPLLVVRNDDLADTATRVRAWILALLPESPAPASSGGGPA